jgi:DNA-binding transcriptional LysR family regulator
MLDLDLLRSFVSVIDAGGFTRAGERVHRSQSTVSQQIRKLEEGLGCELLARDGRRVYPTEHGERLLSYARRILALAVEAREAVCQAPRTEVVRLGLPDDFDAATLTRLVSSFAIDHREVRMSVRCELTAVLTRALEQGDLDVALVKREPGSGPCIAAWPERLHWMGGLNETLSLDPVPLVAFPQGCAYRNRAIHALERAGRPWRIVYESPNLIGVQAALAGNLGVALLEERCLTDAHRMLDDRLPAVAPTELALIMGEDAGPQAYRLADILREYCEAQAAATTGMGKLAAAPSR